MRTERQPAGTGFSAFRRVPITAAVALALSQGAMAATFTVTNNAAFGAGSLAQAISDANNACSTLGDKSPLIQFAGPFVISQSTALPQFFCTSPGAYTPAIDGITSGSVANSDSTGWNATLAVALDGSSNLYGGGCTIEHIDFGGYGGYLTVNGLEIRNFNYGGSEAALCGRVKVSGSALRNNAYGIRADSGSVIGGGAPQERNLIAGGGNAGIEFDGAVTITNNLIGVDFDGTTAYQSAAQYAIAWCGCNTPSGTISNNTISASYIGVYFWSDDALTISGNRIGMDPTGATYLGGGSYGILFDESRATISGNLFGAFSIAIDSGYSSTVLISNNRIGTTGDGSATTNSVSTGINMYSNYGSRIEGNLISGASNNAIYLRGSSDTVVYGNLIGTDASGTSQIANGTGIYIGLSAANNTIEGNVISGNFGAIYASDASFTTFRGNNIGVGSSGAPLPNLYSVLAECGTDLAFINNIISSNVYGGLDLRAIQNSVIQGNTINGNGGHGITLSYTTCGLSEALKASRAKGIVFGIENESSDNQLIANSITSNNGKGIFIEGGSGNDMVQNVIRSNAIDGIRIDARYDGYGAVIAPAIGNLMSQNLVYANDAKNVNLAFDGGPLPNDPGDADTNRPNNGQNYPVLTSATFNPDTNSTTINFDFDSKAGQYNIEFFANPSPGAPAAETFLGGTSPTVATDGVVVSGSFVKSGSWTNISAMATRIGPETPVVADSSELSPQVSATTLPVPGVSVSPSSINFGDVVVGRSSGNSVVTVTSQGTAPYVVNALREDSCTGPAICTSGSFACSTTCTDGSAWSPTTSCTITASFAPSALGAQTKTLALCDNTVGSPRTITFSGNGVPPPSVDIAWSPSSWSFGEVLVGAQGPSKSFTLTNAGATVVYLGAASVTNPDFVVTGNNCGATLAAGASCATDLAFSPSTRGGVNAALEIVGSNVPPTSPDALRRKVTTASTSTATALLQASGVQFGELRLPTSLSFGTFVLRGDAGRQNVELRNTGNGPIAISNITVSGPFTMTHDCGTSLAPGASCTILLSFNPATLGNANGTLNVVTDAAGGSRAIALTASVIADARPVVRITPTVIGFGNRQIGTESNPQGITITNEGAEIANLQPIVVVQPEGEGKTEFVVTSTCGATLAPQASCFANVVFRALGFGERRGELQVPSNAPDSPQKASLVGTGCRPYAAGVNRSGRDPCQ